MYSIECLVEVLYIIGCAVQPVARDGEISAPIVDLHIALFAPLSAKLSISQYSEPPTARRDLNVASQLLDDLQRPRLDLPALDAVIQVDAGESLHSIEREADPVESAPLVGLDCLGEGHPFCGIVGVDLFPVLIEWWFGPFSIYKRISPHNPAAGFF